MAEYSSDEERFSAILNFFKDYKSTIFASLIVITVFSISFFSYNTFQKNKNSKAAELYDSWFSMMASETPNLDSAETYFTDLQTKYKTTGYAQLAKMIHASNTAREGDLKNALVDFNELLNTSSGLWGNNLINSVAKMNIARIEVSLSNFKNALSVLESFDSESEHYLVYELKGDALAGLQRADLAKAQYSKAIEKAKTESQKSLLRIKINSIQ